MSLILANFGGPRSLEEIGAFLEELLCDRDVVKTHLPQFFHRFLFQRIARKRALKIAPDYEAIGGRSPIFFDTLEIARLLAQKLGKTILPFHRYLPDTHPQFIEQIDALNDSEMLVLPLFPQYTFATTGSIARFFQKNLKSVNRLRWVANFHSHPAFIACWQRHIETFLQENQIENPFLLFSAHGIPKSFVKKGDPYQKQCETTFHLVMQKFPHYRGLLAYQSKFGPGEWLQPYTKEVCTNWKETKTDVVVIPISFTSDHIETLYEIEYLYLPLIRKSGSRAFRCPAFNLQSDWIKALAQIATQSPTLKNSELIPIFKGY